MLETISDFFNHPFFVIVGGISTLIAIILAIYSIYLVVTGVLPVWIRLGKSLSNRKIAIYANSDFESLKSVILDCGLFKEKNIVQIQSDTIAKGKDYSVMLINYVEFSDKIIDIIQHKDDCDALLIYAPQSAGRLDETLINAINNERNSIIVNFRGRLLNDILTTMITTKYGKGKA